MGTRHFARPCSDMFFGYVFDFGPVWLLMVTFGHFWYFLVIFGYLVGHPAMRFFGKHKGIGRGVGRANEVESKINAV